MSTLSSAADSLSEGEWGYLSTNNFANILDSGAGQVLQYADYAAWDSYASRFCWVGGAHYEPIKYIVYTESNNTWAHGNVPDNDLPAHGFNHMAADDVGTVYHRETTHVKYIEAGETEWSILGANIPSPAHQVAGGLCWFPERNGLYFFDGQWGTFWYSFDTGLWSRETTALTGVFVYHNVCVYNSTHECVVMGGGNNSDYLYKVDSGGNISAVDNAPEGVGIEQTLFTTDPVSGKYLMFTESGNLYDYEVSTDTWSQLDDSGVEIFTYGNNVINTIQVPIPAYGVLMFVKWSTSGQNVHLYKHTQTSVQWLGGSSIATAASTTVPSVAVGIVSASVPSSVTLTGPAIDYGQAATGTTIAAGSVLYGPAVSYHYDYIGFGVETFTATGFGSETVTTPGFGAETVTVPGFGAETFAPAGFGAENWES